MISTIRWPDGVRGGLKEIHLSKSGCVYEDTRDGSRSHIISYCLDHPQQNSVVKLPIFPVGA